MTDPYTDIDWSQNHFKNFDVKTDWKQIKMLEKKYSNTYLNISARLNNSPKTSCNALQNIT